MTSRPRILCVGATPALQRTLTFTRVEAGAVNRAESVRLGAAGKAVNVARALRTLGADPVVLGFLGGHSGRSVASTVAEEGIRSAWTLVTEQTRSCHTLIDRASGSATELVEESANPPASAWRNLYAAFSRAVPRADLVVISGALPPGCPANRYTRLIRAARLHGVLCVVDTQRETLLHTLAEKPFLVRINRDELERTCGRSARNTAEVLAAMESLRRHGAANVVVSDGKGAVLCALEEGRWKLAPPRVKPLNPVGAGDAMAAGTVYGLATGQSIIEALRFGIGCGSASVLTPTPAVFSPRRAKALAADVRVNWLSRGS